MAIDRQTLNQRAYLRLRQLIESGSVRPGARLDEKALAETLVISRTPLREAIGRLIQDGLVVGVPYRGNFVRTFTAKQVRDLYTVRKALEGVAARLAAPRFSTHEVEQCHDALAECDAAVAANDIERYSRADEQFHEAVVRASENDTLIDTLGRLRGQIQLVRAFANTNAGLVSRALDERHRILAALVAHDGELAEQLLEEHIDDVCQSVIRDLQSQSTG